VCHTAAGWSVSVAPCGAPPEANPSGPYSGIVNTMSAFDGSLSFDTDDTTGTGVAPSHTDSTIATYNVTLVVIANDAAPARVSPRWTSPVSRLWPTRVGRTLRCLIIRLSSMVPPCLIPGDNSLACAWDVGEGGTETVTTGGGRVFHVRFKMIYQARFPLGFLFANMHRAFVS